MASDPEFFMQRRRRATALDPAIESARRALLVAIEVALASAEQRRERAGPSLQMLRAVCFEAGPAELMGLTFPLGRDALIDCLGRRCGEWLPYADELGVAEERLLLLGWPTASCREIQQRLGRDESA
jgi:hypothetical protein